MNELDDSIREALTAEGDEWMEEYDEQSIHEMLVGVFQGTARWMAALGFVSSLVFLVLAAVCAVQFFRTETESTRELIGWATGFLFCSMSIGMMKIWFFLQMNQNSLTREIKRFELQMARLAKRLGD